MRLPSYLQINKYGIYYFRIVFRNDVRLHLNKLEFKRSLRTSVRIHAINLARIFKIEAENAFDHIIINKMNWIETQKFLNHVAEKILSEYNEQLSIRGPYSIVKSYSERQAENDAEYFLKMKVMGYSHVAQDLIDSEDLLWGKQNGHLSSIISIREIANKIIKEYNLTITEDKYEIFCRQIAEMLWGLNIRRKKLIHNFRMRSPHVWFNNSVNNDLNDLISDIQNNNCEINDNNSADLISTIINNDCEIKVCELDIQATGKHLLKEIFDEYIFYALKTEKSIKDISVINYTNKFKLCYDILLFCMNLNGNSRIYIEDINDDHVRTLKYVIERFPRRIDIRFKDYSVVKICELIMNKHQFPVNNEIKKYLNDTIGIKTIQNYTIPLRNAIEFAKTNKIVKESVFDIFKYKVPIKIKKDNQGKPFNIEELNRLFTTEIFTSKTFNRNYKYWLPLILFFTGARRNEICNLKISDQIINEGIHCIIITDSKTSAGIRTIPLHSKLIDIGFIDYIEYQKKKNCEYIFDELVDSHNENKRPTTRGNAVSKWFNNASENENRKGYLDVCGIKDDGKKLHSFRNTFINNLKQQGVEILIIKQIVGHSSNDVTSDVYSEPYNIKMTKMAVERLTFKNNQFPWNINKHYNKIKFPWNL
jgi:integrase